MCKDNWSSGAYDVSALQGRSKLQASTTERKSLILPRAGRLWTIYSLATPWINLMPNGYVFPHIYVHILGSEKAQVRKRRNEKDRDREETELQIDVRVVMIPITDNY